MWDRKQIKKDGIKLLKNNLWTLVFLAIFMSVAIERYMINNDAFSNLKILYDYITTPNVYIEENANQVINEYADKTISQFFTGNVTGFINEYNEKNNVTKGVVYEAFNVLTKGQLRLQNMFNSIMNYFDKEVQESLTVVLASAIGLTISALVVGPIRVGESRIYLESINYKKTRIKRITYAFKKERYWGAVKTVMLMEIRKFLWNLTIIGGIIKNYSYKMVTYIVAENPNISPTDAISISNEMMYGNKWNAFKLDLSFIGWIILQVATFGLAGIFISPYYTATYTELYKYLREDYIKNQKYRYELLNDNKLFEINDLEKYPDELEVKRKKIKIKYNKKYEPTSIIIFFFIFSFIGWLWEVSLFLFRDGIFVNRGTLHGPWLPIYGFGCTIIILLTKIKAVRRMLKNPTLTFCVIVVLCSIIEYVTSWYIEYQTGLRYWDYTGIFLNLNGRICFECSMFFGIGGALCVYIVAPFLEKKIQKLTTKVKIILCTILVSTICTDYIYSLQYPNVGEGITETVEKEK